MTRTNLKQLGQRLQDSWKILFKSGAWIIVTIGTFLIPPPTWDFQGGEDKSWFHFAQFLVAALVGLVFVPMLLLTARRYTWRWWGTAMILLIMATTSFFFYQYRRSTWTSIYNGNRIVIGDDSSLLPDAKKYRIGKTYMTDEMLIADSAGAIEAIWSKESIVYHRMVFGAMYLLSAALFSVFILSVIQTIDCSLNNETKKMPAKSKPASTSSVDAANDRADQTILP